MRFNIFDRIVAGVRIECIYTVETVLTEATTIGPFRDVHVHPIISLCNSGVRDDLEVAHPGADLAGRSLGKSMHKSAGHYISGTKPGDCRRREGGVADRS